jgi:predicted Zn-dependent protease
MQKSKSRPSQRFMASLAVLLLLPFVWQCTTTSALGLERSQAEGTISSGDQFSDYLLDAAPEGLYCWPQHKLPVKVFFQPSTGVPGYEESFPRILASCFDEWVRHSDGKLDWKEVSDPNEADIICRWTDQVTERADGTEGGRTKISCLYNPSTNCGTIRRGLMTLLTHPAYGEFTASELKRAYLHEVGHAFGIAGHSPCRQDVMYYKVSRNQDAQLTSRDVNTMKRLYEGYPLLNARAKRPTGVHT